MRGNVRFARLAGVIALGGAFYTATYITSYRGGAPTYAFLGLLAGTAGGIVALAWPRSSTILTLAAVLLGFAFTGAFIESGIGFLPGFVLMIMAAVRASRPVDFAFLEGRGEPEELPGRAVRRSGNAGSFAWMRLEQGDAPSVVTVPEADAVVTVPDAQDVVTLPDAAPTDLSRVSRDGLIQAGPPGVIGLLPHSRDQRPRADGAG